MSENSLFRRLRFFDSEEADLRGLTVEQLVEVMEVFPPGWSRRRALEGLLRRGIPSTLGDALELVRRTTDEPTRLWALTALASRTELTEAERQAVEEAAEGNAALERRLAIRFRL